MKRLIGLFRQRGPDVEWLDELQHNSRHAIYTSPEDVNKLVELIREAYRLRPKKEIRCDRCERQGR